MSLNNPKTRQPEAEEVLTIEGVAHTVEDADVTGVTQHAEVAEQVANSAAESAPEQEGKAVVAHESGSVTVAEARSNALKQFTEEQAAAGFDGLDVTGYSFPRIKLHEGKFKIGEDDEDLGESFDAVIQTTRRLYVVRQHDGQTAEVYYSYDKDGRTLADGSSADATLAKWLDDGYGTEDTPLDIKEYLEALAILVNREDEHEEAMVMLSIPPTSRDKLSGAAVQAKQRFGALLSDVVVKCQVGKSRGEGTKKYRPWVFTLAGRYAR